MRCVIAVMVLCCGCILQVQGQQTPVYPYKTTEYFTREGRKISSAEGAAYRVETTHRDSVAGQEREYDAEGKVRVVRPYANVKKQLLHGTKTTWYATGKPHTKEDYLNGARSGELLVYYPDGTLRRRDAFAKGVRTAGECFGPDGKPVTYFEYMQRAVYSKGDGGNQAIVEAISREAEYPREVLRQMDMHARVFISFVVDKDGRVTNPTALPLTDSTRFTPKVRTAYRQLQIESLRAVRKLKAFVPARFDGEPVSMTFTVPITFKTE